jgi:hypothetical protein
MTIKEELTQVCNKLYDARTSAAQRRDLSMRASILRCRLMRTRDPLTKLARASESDEEC